MPKLEKFKISEEAANILTHGFGLVLFLILCPFLVIKGMDLLESRELVGIIIFSLSIILVFATSTIYHSFRQPRLKYIFQIIDHISIYFLIAGTHTPFVFLFVQNDFGKNYLIALWILVLIGIVYKSFFFGTRPLLSVIYYLIMGWLAVLIFPYLLELMPGIAFYWLIGGGVLYTLGVIFYLWEKLPYSHSIWHIFVIGGAIGHYFAVYYSF